MPLLVLDICSTAISVVRREKHTVTNNDKKRARLNCINHLLRTVPFEEFNNKCVTVRDRTFDPKFGPQTPPDNLNVLESY